jgi:hypothetical protein
MNDAVTTQEQGPGSHKRLPFARRAARLSLIAPLIAVAIYAVMPDPRLRETKLIVGGAQLAAVVAGFILAIVALRGIRVHGREGIRRPAIAGLVVNGVLILLNIAAFIILLPALTKVARVVNAGYTRAEMEEMPRVIPDSRVVLNEAIGFRIEIPGDFLDNTETLPPDMLYSFLRTNADGTNMVINIECLRGTLSKEPLGREALAAMRGQLPPGGEVGPITVQWKTHWLTGFAVRLPMNDMQCCSYSVQVPLAREAIQINVGGPADSGQRCYELLTYVLTGLNGLSNWDPLPVLQEHAGIRPKAGSQEISD